MTEINFISCTYIFTTIHHLLYPYTHYTACLDYF